MASSFELGCEQPQTYRQRAQKLTGRYQGGIGGGRYLLVLITASSYQNLFGCPATRSRPLSKKVNPPAKKDTRTRKQKPLPGMIRAIQKLYNSLRGRGEVTKKLHKITWLEGGGYI